MPLSRSAGLFNLAAFNRIVFSAVMAGILAGLLLTGVQQLQVSKIILQAEVYEDAADAAKQAAAAQQAATRVPPAHGQPGHDHQRDHAAMAAEPGHAEHEHEHEAHEHGGWQPTNGAERIFFTVVANVSVAASFGLVLCAIYCASGLAAGWRIGLLWGLAGYAVFFLAPSLGLPPEVPGTASAPLHERQLWWVLTAMLTAGGLGLLCFARGWALKALGLVLLAAPHLAGAPQPEVHGSAAPEELARAFIYATAIANAMFWLALGALTGFFYKKFA